VGHAPGVIGLEVILRVAERVETHPGRAGPPVDPWARTLLEHAPNPERRGRAAARGPPTGSPSDQGPPASSSRRGRSLQATIPLSFCFSERLWSARTDHWFWSNSGVCAVGK